MGCIQYPHNIEMVQCFSFQTPYMCLESCFFRCSHFWLKIPVKILLFCMLQQDLYFVLIRPLNILPVDIQAIPFLILQLRSMIEGAMLKILQVSCLLLSLSRFTSSSLNVLVLLSYLLYFAIELFYVIFQFLFFCFIATIFIIFVFVYWILWRIASDHRINARHKRKR